MTISGEARKAFVSGLPSLRPAKLRLKDSMMELGVLVGLDVADRALPLADAGAAGRGEHGGVELFEDLEHAVALERVVDAGGARHDHERRLDFDAVFERLAGDRGGAGDVLVGGVRAGADQRDLQLLRIALGLDRFGDLGDRHGGVGRERAVDVGLEFGEIDFDDAVVVLGRVRIDFRVGGEVDLGGKLRDGRAAGGGEVAGHGVVIGEDGRRGAHFRAHVADRGLARGG